MYRIYLLVDCDGSWGDLAFPFAKIPTPILDEFSLSSIGIPKLEEIEDLPDILSKINTELTALELQLAELEQLKKSIKTPRQGILSRLQNQISDELSCHRQRLAFAELESERLKLPKHSVEAKQLTEADRKLVEVYTRLDNILFNAHEASALSETIDHESDAAHKRQFHLLKLREVLVEYFDKNVQTKTQRMRQALERFLTIASDQSNDRYVVSNSARWSSCSEMSHSIIGKTQYFENLHKMATATGATLLPGLLIDAIQLQAPGFTIQKVQQHGLRKAHDDEINYFDENKSASSQLLSEHIGPGALATTIIDRRLDDLSTIREHIAVQLERGNKSSVFEYCLHQINTNENIRYAADITGRRRIVIVDDREDVLISLQRLLHERYMKDPHQFSNTDIKILKIGPNYKDFKELSFSFQSRVDTSGAKTTRNASNARAFVDTSTSSDSVCDFLVEQLKRNSSRLSTRLRILIDDAHSGKSHDDNDEFNATQSYEEPTTTTGSIAHLQFFNRLPQSPQKPVIDVAQGIQNTFWKEGCLDCS